MFDAGHARLLLFVLMCTGPAHAGSAMK